METTALSGVATDSAPGVPAPFSEGVAVPPAPDVHPADKSAAPAGADAITAARFIQSLRPISFMMRILP